MVNINEYISAEKNYNHYKCVCIDIAFHPFPLYPRLDDLNGSTKRVKINVFNLQVNKKKIKIDFVFMADVCFPLLVFSHLMRSISREN